MDTIDIYQVKDATQASRILDELAIRDQNEEFCKYPYCPQPRMVTTKGRPAAYCDNPEHTALTNHRARQYLKTLLSEKAGDSSPSTEAAAVNIKQVESLRSSVMAGMRELQGNLEQYVTFLSTLADPDLSAAQIQATIARADMRVADMQESLSAERNLRQAAEAAKNAAQGELQAAQEAADLAIEQMEEAERLTKRVQEETELQIIQAQEQAQEDIRNAQQQADEAVAEAKAGELQAKEQAGEAERRARSIEVEAKAQVAASERLVQEARQALESERIEVTRLRTELGEAHVQARADQEQARKDLEQEKGEATRLRAELGEVRTQARTDQEQARASLEQERAETQRLRTELGEVRAQARTDQEQARSTLEGERAETRRQREELAAARQRITQLEKEADELRHPNQK